jgi:regulator of chromosome condensation
VPSLSPNTINLAKSTFMALRRADLNAVSNTKTLNPSRKRDGPKASSDRLAKRIDARASKSVNLRKKKVAQDAQTQTLDIALNNAPQTKLQIYVCGEGSAGELGLGPKNATNVKTPRVNPNLAGVVSVATGGMHAAALTADNKILTWGINDLFTLGRDTTWDGGVRDVDEENSDTGSETELNPKESTPTAIPSSSFPLGTEFVQVAAGDSTTFALTDKGLVYGWGTFRVSSLPTSD